MDVSTAPTNISTTKASSAVVGDGSVLMLDFAMRINVSYQPGVERRFSAHVYLSRRLQATALRRANTALPQQHHHCHHSSPHVHVVHLPLTQEVEQQQTAGVLKLQVALNGLRWRLGRNASIEALTESTLNVDIFAHIQNSGGEDCFNQMGCARIPLIQLMARTHSADIMRYDLIVPGMRTKNYSKGVLAVLPASGLGAARVFLNQVPTVVEVHNKATVDEMAKRSLHINMALFEEHMLKWIEFFQSGQVQTGFKCTEGINVWRYDSRVGIEPFEAFANAPLPEPNPVFYEHALDIVLARYGLSHVQWLERSNLDAPQRDSFAERVLCEVITLFVCVCNYVPDLVYANTSSIDKGRGKKVAVLTQELIESFDFCRVRRALDCEDSALECMWEFYELHKLYREQYAHISPALRRLVEVAHCYHATLWLVGVSGAEINEEKMADIDSMDAHMHVALVPKAMWVEWCRRGQVAMDDRVMPLHSAEWGDTPQAYARSQRCRGVMINEGTGFLEPTGDDDTLDMRTILYKLMQQACGPAFDLGRKVYGFKRGEPSGFYKLVVGIYTSAFLLRGGLACGFVPCYRDDLRKYVVRFQDVTADAERQRIAVRMLPPISMQARQEIERVSVDLYPVGPLEHASANPEDDATWIKTARANMRSAERALRRLVRVSSRSTAATTLAPSAAPQQMVIRLPVMYHLKYEMCTVDALQALVNGAGQVFDASAATVISVASNEPKHMTQRSELEFSFRLEALSIREERVCNDLGAFRVEFTVVATSKTIGQ